MDGDEGFISSAVGAGTGACMVEVRCGEGVVDKSIIWGQLLNSHANLTTSGSEYSHSVYLIAWTLR